MPRNTSLTDLQLIILSHAAKNDDGSARPFPACIDDDARTEREVQILLRRGLLEEIPGTPPRTFRVSNEAFPILAITKAGKSAIGLGTAGEDEPVEHTPLAPAAGQAPVPRATSRETILPLLRQKGGASIMAICEATGWQPHSARAYFTRLRKKGLQIERSSSDAGTVYALVEVAHVEG